MKTSNKILLLNKFMYYSNLIIMVFRDSICAIKLLNKKINSDNFYHVLKLSIKFGISISFYLTLIIVPTNFLLNNFYLSNNVLGVSKGFSSVIAISLTRSNAKTIPEKILKVFLVSFFSTINEILTSKNFGEIISEIILGITIGVFVGVFGNSKKSNNKGLILTLLLFLFGSTIQGISNGILSGIIYGIIYSIHYGIIYRVIFKYDEGISVGLCIGIIHGIFIGLSYGIIVDPYSPLYLTISAITISLVINIGIKNIFSIYESFFLISILTLLYSGSIAYNYNNKTSIIFLISYYCLFFRLYYYPLSFLYLFGAYNGKWYKLHPFYWDKNCLIPIPFLDKMLYSFYKYDNYKGLIEIDKTIKNSFSQKMHALKAKTKIIFKKAKNEKDLAKIKNIISKLPEGSKGFLKETNNLKNMIKEISNKQIKIYNSISEKIKEDRILELINCIKTLDSSSKGFKPPLNTELDSILKFWLENAKNQLNIVQEYLSNYNISSVFQASESVKRNNYAFIRRDNVINEIINSINLGINGILIYGRRRIGKTTILYNLDSSLSTNAFNIIYISMQNAKYSLSLENNFIPNLVKNICMYANISITKNNYTIEDLSEILNTCNKIFSEKNKRILICIDEYEGINDNIINGKFSIELLPMIRESIKNNSNIYWILSGSCRLNELKKIQWTSYLISFKTIEIPPFTFDETKFLLTEPFKFADSEHLKNTKINIWGQGTIEKIYYETAGWPYFVQGLAQNALEIMKNEKMNVVNSYILEKAIEKTINISYISFDILLNKESKIPGEWNYILEFTNTNKQLKPSNPLIRESLKRRLLVKEENNMWTLNVPLMERWLKSSY